ncbi:hypothetical protein F5X99DRAFT_385826 [Biscogniauxia marginata]|nr:hypothetical protein F5X99DRAFT_385826 [Biscogniauxia marginata]
MTTLPVIYDGVRQPELDIVSIPGLPTLNPHYELKNHNTWLREVLSHQIPRARIMAFQYDFAKGNSNPSWRDLLAHVDKLLYALIHRRENAESRPLVFVCYSFGAVILKKALLIAKQRLDFYNILERTGGIIFLGCLHDESDPDFESSFLKCAAVEFKTSTRHDAIDSLKKSDDWTVIKDVLESFRYLRSPFPVRILYELKVTSVQDKIWMMKRSKPGVLCSERISTLGWDNERLIGVEKDHSELMTYPHRGDREGFFHIFMETLSEIVEMVSPQSAEILHTQSSPATLGEDPWSLYTSFARASNLSVASLGTSLSSIIEPVAPTPAPEHKDLSCFILQPYGENPNFVGREEVLDEIHAALNPTSDTPKQRTFALTGLGGIGKTQTAISYAYRHQETYKIVLWAHADGQAKMSESFSLFAETLGLGRSLIPTQAKEAVKDFLSSTSIPWLMIFDNADATDRIDLFKEFWPKAEHGSILITSRNHTLLNQFSGLPLAELDDTNAVDLLFKLTRHNRAGMPDSSIQEEQTAAKQIVARIGYLPLGINQAANLIVHDSCTMVEFLEAYSLRELINDSEEVQLVTSDETYKYSLRTVWNMNYDRLSPDQQDLLKLMSFLDPDRIQMQLLRDGASKAGGPMFAFMSTPYKLNKCRSGLLKSALVSQSENKLELRMHRLVQASCHLRMSLEERQQKFRQAMKLIVAVWPVPPREAIHDPSLWEAQRALLPHVQRLCALYVEHFQRGEYLVSENVVDWGFPSMLYEAGWFSYESGLLASVPDLLQPAKQYCDRHVHKGGGYRVTADIYNGLACLDTETNQFQSAYEQFSKFYKLVYDAIDHGELVKPSIYEVFALGRIGNALNGLHRFAEAEKYYHKMMVEWDKHSGDRKMYKSHLATCLWLQGKLDEAEIVVRPVIKDQNDTSNFRTAVAMYSLGNIQRSQAEVLTSRGMKDEATAKFNESMALHMKVHILWTKVLGAKHHRTADAAYKVGWHFHRLQDYEKASAWLQQALGVYSEHPRLFKNEIARTKYKLGCAYQDMGKEEEGSELINEAEGLRQEIVPPEKWEPANGEQDFDEIVQFWSR